MLSRIWTGTADLGSSDQDQSSRRRASGGSAVERGATESTWSSSSDPYTASITSRPGADASQTRPHVVNWILPVSRITDIIQGAWLRSDSVSTLIGEVACARVICTERVSLSSTTGTLSFKQFMEKNMELTTLSGNLLIQRWTDDIAPTLGESSSKFWSSKGERIVDVYYNPDGIGIVYLLRACGVVSAADGSVTFHLEYASLCVLPLVNSQPEYRDRLWRLVHEHTRQVAAPVEEEHLVLSDEDASVEDARPLLKGLWQRGKRVEGGL